MSVVVNHWAAEQIPYSWNQKRVQLAWSGSDQAAVADPEWQNTDISYCYNAQGFRTHDLVALYNKEVDIALGCSFTEGIGLPAENIWPSLIEQRSDLPLLNLGLGGGSTDTVARILTNVAGLYRIRTVYILWPFPERFELCTKNHIVPMVPGRSGVEHTWFHDGDNSDNRFNKNQAITKQLAGLYGFQIKERQARDPWAILGDLARDCVHNGIQSHQNLVNMFLNS